MNDFYLWSSMQCCEPKCKYTQDMFSLAVCTSDIACWCYYCRVIALSTCNWMHNMKGPFLFVTLNFRAVSKQSLHYHCNEIFVYNFRWRILWREQIASILTTAGTNQKLIKQKLSKQSFVWRLFDVCRISDIKY